MAYARVIDRHGNDVPRGHCCRVSNYRTEIMFGNARPSTKERIEEAFKVVMQDGNVFTIEHMFTSTEHVLSTIKRLTSNDKVMELQTEVICF